MKSFFEVCGFFEDQALVDYAEALCARLILRKEEVMFWGNRKIHVSGTAYGYALVWHESKLKFIKFDEIKEDMQIVCLQTLQDAPYDLFYQRAVEYYCLDHYSAVWWGTHYTIENSEEWTEKSNK